MTRARTGILLVVLVVVGVSAAVAIERLSGSEDVIVFSALYPDGIYPQLFAINTDGSGLRQLTRQPSEKSAIAWAPDGSRIAYASLIDDPGPGEWPGATSSIYSMRPDGTDLRMLCRACSRNVFTATPALDADGVAVDDAGYRQDVVPGALAWSPDSSLLATPSARGGVLLIDPISGAMSTIRTPRQATALAWSPDGKRLAVSHTWFFTAEGRAILTPESGTTYTESTPMRGRPGGFYLLDVTTMAVDDVVATTGVAHIRGWMPDGNVIVFSRNPGFGMHESLSPSSVAELSAYSVAKRRTSTIIAGERHTTHFGVATAPSGRIATLIARFGQDSSTIQLSVTRDSGPERIDLPVCDFKGHSGCQLAAIAWSPDGARIAYRGSLAGAPLTAVIVLQGARNDDIKVVRLPGLFPDFLGESCCLAWHADV